jgi:hypothetical protein
MAQFSTYGFPFDVPDRYAEGQPLSAKEAAALNGLMAEMISHKVRALLSKSLGYAKGAVLENEEHIAKAKALVAEEAATYEFGAGRGPGQPREVLDPVAKVARELAEKEVRAVVKANSLKVGKKDGSNADEAGVYSWEKFDAKVREVMTMEEIVAAAKKIVREASKPSVGVTL